MSKTDRENEWFRDSIASRCNSSTQAPAEVFDDDFIPSSYQKELAFSIKNSSKIVFLPAERDKFYTALFSIRYFSRELTRFGENPSKKIFYVADSVEKAHLVSSFFRQCVSLNVGCVSSTITKERWNDFFENNQLLVLPCQLYESSLEKFPVISTEVCLVVFDDCVHVIDNKHPMKEIIGRFPGSPRILGLTSVLILGDVQLQFVYKNLKQMEVVFKSAIITSQSCNLVKKYLTDVKVKFVKYPPFSKISESHTLSRVRCLMDNLRTIFDKLNCGSNNERIIKKKLLSLLDECQNSLENFGLYPASILCGLSQVKLEKMKLHCKNVLFISISAAISDINVIRSLLEKEMERIAPADSVAGILKNCCPKVGKLLSLLIKMNYEDCCIIFVKDGGTAQLMSYVLQKISAMEMKMSSITADFLADYYSPIEIASNREQCFYEKNKRTVLRKFHHGIINTLVLSWETLLETSDLSADWIIYFDMPPTYMSYVVSRKYSNNIANKSFFFLEEFGQKNDVKCNVDLIEPFAQLDLILKEVFQKKDINNVKNLGKWCRTSRECDEGINKRFSPLITRRNKRATASMAINIVNKYCSCLPGDAFSQVAPRWWICEKTDGVICSLQLPVQSSIRSFIESAPVRNVTLAKHIVALDTIKMLYTHGHLDDALIPSVRRVNQELLHDSGLFPQWKKDDDMQAGSSNCCRVVPLHVITTPEWLCNCAPQSKTDCYLHIIRLKPNYKVPKIPRKKFFYDLLDSQNEFGIVTSTELPKICLFPIYMDLGQVDVSIEVNAVVLKFNEEQIQALISFHRFIFLDVLQVVKQFLVHDDSNTSNSYCIVPLTPTDDGKFGIAWDVVNHQSVKQEIVEPSDEQKIRTDYAGSGFLGKVITPWYRVLPQQYYIVTKVLADCTPNSPFSSREFRTFSEYYANKYGIEVKQPIQPLLAARAISINFNCIRPRSQNPGVLRKKGEKEVDFDETLIPELCIMEPFPAVYWYKSITLLAITHRLHYILMAETIRRRIASFEGTASFALQSEDDTDVLIADNDCINEIEETVKPVVPVSSILKDVKLAKKRRSYPWSNEMLPVDDERTLDKTCVLELMAQHDFMKLQNKSSQEFFEIPAMIIENRDPSLKFLKLNRKLSPGPKQRDILQALTMSKCGDIVNLERCKLAGGAFLEFAASLGLYKLYPDLNVLQLSHLKQKLIGKRNLFYCGSKLQLGSMLKLQDMSLNNDWNFGGFCIPELLVKISVDSGISPEVIFNLEIPRNEQISGIISSETRNDLHERMLNYYNETTKEDANFQHRESMSSNDNKNYALTYFKKQSVPDKAVVDVLKALVGVYLMNCGVEAGLKFLQFVDVLKIASIQEICTVDVKSHSSDEFIDVEKLSNQINYKFKSNQLPLEAFLHHSCSPASSVSCNQKLAFLGDSILDFLITGFIYENCGHLSISEVEDIRVALVNDVLFAALLVQKELHKFLMVESPSLMEKINKFVSQQERVDFKIDHDEFLFLVEETSSQLTESVDVPKALPDAFKAIMAAVFIDSSGDLETVWAVCYNIMKREIETFMKYIPRNPVKLLNETNLTIEYEKPKLLPNEPNLLEVRMNVLIDEENRSFVGIGSSKHRAMRIAAKLALKNLAKKFTL